MSIADARHHRLLKAFVIALCCSAPILRAGEPAAAERSFFDFGEDPRAAGAHAAPPAGQTLLPLPDAAAQAAASKSLHDMYPRQFADESAQGRVALARELLTRATDQSMPPALRYVALRQAGNVATAAGDFALLIQSLTAAGRLFQLDAAAAKQAALVEFLRSNPGMGSPTARTLADAANKLAEEAILRGKPELAVSIATLAEAAAKLTKDDPFMRQAAARVSDIRLLQIETAKTAPAFALLEKSPGDADANLAVGRFLCLWRGDWRTGLPLLVKGSDTALKELAAQELSAASDAPMQLAMGNAWWDYAIKLEGPPRAYAQDHAADAYLQAIPDLQGIYKTMAQKRVAEAPARLPFPRMGGGETQTAAIRGAAPLATAIYIVADDFVTQIYHNGRAVPNSDRKLLAEIYGAQVERVALDLKRGDWVVFNVVNNRLRWNGAYYFAAGFLNDKDALVYASSLNSGDWSSCDDVKEIAAFISDREHEKDHRPQAVATPWDRGDQEIGKLQDWNGQAIWGDAASRSTWLKFIVPEK